VHLTWQNAILLPAEFAIPRSANVYNILMLYFTEVSLISV